MYYTVVDYFRVPLSLESNGQLKEYSHMTQLYTRNDTIINAPKTVLRTQYTFW